MSTLWKESVITIFIIINNNLFFFKLIKKGLLQYFLNSTFWHAKKFLSNWLLYKIKIYIFKKFFFAHWLCTEYPCQSGALKSAKMVQFGEVMHNVKLGNIFWILSLRESFLSEKKLLIMFFHFKSTVLTAKKSSKLFE